MTRTYLALALVEHADRAPTHRHEYFGLPAAKLNTIGLSKAEAPPPRRTCDDLPDKSTAYRGLMVSSG